MILDYFGDEAEVVDCACDVCRGGEELAALAAAGGGDLVIPDELVLLVRKILSAVARLNGRFGVGAVAEVLKGEESDRTRRWQLDQLSVFGLLREIPLKRIMAMVYRVIDSGLAQQREVQGSAGRFPIVELTGPGVAVMKGQDLPPAGLIDLLPRNEPARPQRVRREGGRASGRSRAGPGGNGAAADLPEDLSLEAQARFDKLRGMRSRLAVERQVPTYVIFHDSVLKAIAATNPNSEDDLSGIKGMGAYKLKEFGPFVLEALQE